MIKIVIKQNPIANKDICEDMQYNLKCTIVIPEDDSVIEATYAWFKALEVNGYSRDTVRKLMEKMGL